MRKDELIKLTRDQIAGAIRNDLTNSESLMKEVFEECDGKKDLEIVYAEMRRIIRMIEAP